MTHLSVEHSVLVVLGGLLVACALLFAVLLMFERIGEVGCPTCGEKGGHKDDCLEMLRLHETGEWD